MAKKRNQKEENMSDTEQTGNELVEQQDAEQTQAADEAAPAVPTAEEPEQSETPPADEEQDETPPADEEPEQSETPPADEEQDETPPADEEPKQDEAAVNLELENQIKIDKDARAKQVAGIISNGELSNSEKISKIAAEAIPVYQMIAAKILSYNHAMNPKMGVDEVLGAAKQYDLLSTLKQVINTEDYGMFKTKFDIVNLGYRAFADEAFAEIMLFRFQQKWRWSAKDLTTVQHLATVITTLCDLSTRATNLKKLDINRALDQDAITLSETGISNLKKYYTM